MTSSPLVARYNSRKSYEHLRLCAGSKCARDSRLNVILAHCAGGSLGSVMYYPVYCPCVELFLRIAVWSVPGRDSAIFSAIQTVIQYRLSALFESTNENVSVNLLLMSDVGV